MFKDNVSKKKIASQRIRKRIRKKISGTPERPRVLVTRTNRYMYVQAIDDLNGAVLSSASTLEKAFREKLRRTFHGTITVRASRGVSVGAACGQLRLQRPST